eukprot:154730-Pleurochrysis_carterae.AAC.1
MHRTENGTESHLYSSFSSAAASFRPASSALFLRFSNCRYLNLFSRPTDSYPFGYVQIRLSGYS